MRIFFRRAPLWSDQQKLASAENRDRLIADNIVTWLRYQFPNDAIGNATIKRIKHYTDYSTVECIPGPDDTDYASYILVIRFNKKGSGHVIATYYNEYGRHALLSTGSGNAPKDMPGELF